MHNPKSYKPSAKLLWSPECITAFETCITAFEIWRIWFTNNGIPGSFVCNLHPTCGKGRLASPTPSRPIPSYGESRFDLYNRGSSEWQAIVTHVHNLRPFIYDPERTLPLSIALQNEQEFAVEASILSTIVINTLSPSDKECKQRRLQKACKM